MTLFAVVLRSLAPLFLLILLGWFLKARARVLHPGHVPVLNGLVINVTLPALIFLALTRAPKLPASDARLPVALWLAEAATLVVAYAAGYFLRMPRSTRGAWMLVGVFGNTAFLGYPITLALLPHEFPQTVLLDEFGCVLVLYLVAAVVGGAFGANGGDHRAALGRFVRNPLLWSVLTALAVRLIPWPPTLFALPGIHAVGSVLAQCLSYLSLGTTPLILLSLGVSLQPRAALAAPWETFWPCVLKLCICPALMFMFCRWFGLHGDLLRVGVLQAAMPASVLSSVLCAQNEMNGPLAVGVVFLGTVLSLATLPLVLTLLH
jgi:predicted permease